MDTFNSVNSLPCIEKGQQKQKRIGLSFIFKLIELCAETFLMINL